MGVGAMGLRLGWFRLCAAERGCAESSTASAPCSTRAYASTKKKQKQNPSIGRHSAYWWNPWLAHRESSVPSEPQLARSRSPGDLAERFSPAGRYLRWAGGNNDFYQAGEKRTDHTAEGRCSGPPTPSCMWCLNLPSSPYRSFPESALCYAPVPEVRNRSDHEPISGEISFSQGAKGGLLADAPNKAGKA